MSNSKEKLEVIYLPYIHKWGKITNLAGLLLGFLPVLYLGIFYGWWPEAGPVISGWLSIAGIVGISWVMQPIQFSPFWVLQVPICPTSPGRSPTCVCPAPLRLSRLPA